jgi:hypothetical protein
MSLLTTDLSKVKKLSLQGAKLPIKEKEPEPTNYPPSPEEKAYRKLVDINPLIEELVDRLDLVSKTTGERIKRVDTANLKPEVKQEIDKPKLIALAQRLLKVETSYSREEIIDKIKETTSVNQERAEKGFNLILQAGAIEMSIGERYNLIGSTPF